MSSLEYPTWQVNYVDDSPYGASSILAYCGQVHGPAFAHWNTHSGVTLSDAVEALEATLAHWRANPDEWETIAGDTGWLRAHPHADKWLSFSSRSN